MGNIKRFLSKNWLLVMIFSLPAGWALFVPGFFGASDDMHIAWLYEMDRIIKMGQIPPRFAPDLSYGFGYPLFNFVFPLPFYVGELFHLIGLSFVDSIKAVFFISLPLSALSMFLFLKEFTSKWLSFVGALLYVYTPYRATDLFVRGAIGEIASFAILPLIALALVKLTGEQKRNARWIGIGGMSLATLVLSHNITAYMFLPFIFLLGILRIIFNSSFKVARTLNFILMVLIGLLGSLYFWLPAIADSFLMKQDSVFNFIDHFPTLRQLVTPYWGYGASVPGPYDGMSFFLGSANIVVLVFGPLSFILFWKKFEANKKIIISWAILSMLVSIFMMNNRSSFIWQNVPLISYFQFPWRFEIMTTFLVPIFIIALEKLKAGKVVALLVITMAVTLNVANFRPQDFLGRQDSYFINRFIPVPVASVQYQGLMEEYLRLPLATTKRPDKNYPLATIVNGEIKSISKINDLNMTIETYSSQATTLLFNKYFFPGWKAEIDHQKIGIAAAKPFGQIAIDVPSGAHTIQVKFGETLTKTIFDIISLGAIFLAILLVFRHKKV